MGVGERPLAEIQPAKPGQHVDRTGTEEQQAATPVSDIGHRGQPPGAGGSGDQGLGGVARTRGRKPIAGAQLCEEDVPHQLHTLRLVQWRAQFIGQGLAAALVPHFEKPAIFQGGQRHPVALPAGRRGLRCGRRPSRNFPKRGFQRRCACRVQIHTTPLPVLAGASSSTGRRSGAQALPVRVVKGELHHPPLAQRLTRPQGELGAWLALPGRQPA